MGTQLFKVIQAWVKDCSDKRLHHMPVLFQNKPIGTEGLSNIVHFPAFPTGFWWAVPRWKKHLELGTVQGWTSPIKTGIKKTILGDGTLIFYPESPVTTSYYIFYTSCGISVVGAVVTIAGWQHFSGRYLSCTKQSACQTGSDLVCSLPDICPV